MSREGYESLQVGSAVAGIAESAWIEAEPKEAPDKTMLIGEAYDEYCRRRERGEVADPEAFCQGFPFASSLHHLLVVDQFLDECEEFVEAGGTARWPKPGAYFLGFVLHRELGRGAFARVFLATEPA